MSKAIAWSFDLLDDAEKRAIPPTGLCSPVLYRGRGDCYSNQHRRLGRLSYWIDWNRS